MDHTARGPLVFLAACMAFGLASCSSGSRSLPPGAASSAAPRQFYTPPGAVLDVNYTSNTVRIDLPTVQKILRSVSSDGRLLLFDASDPRISELTQGKVILLEHIGVRRVLATLRQGSQIAVLTDTPALTDFIQDGTIKFSMPLTIRRAQTQSPHRLPASALLDGFRGWFGVPAIVYAQEKKEEEECPICVHVKGEANNWEFEAQAAPEGEGLKLSLDAGKKLAGLTASVKAEGKVEHISTAFSAAVHGGKLQELEYNTPLQGEFHVKWAALTTGENGGIGESRLKCPPFAKQVIDVYGIPFLFQVEANLIFKPGFGTPHDAAEGGFDVTYDGSGGIDIHGDQSSPAGKMDGEYSLEKTTSESLAAHGVVLALDLPRVSLSLGTESFEEAVKEALPSAALDKAAEELEKVPFFAGLLKKAKEDFFKLEGAAYVQLVTEFDFAASGPLSLVPCRMTHLNMNGEAGVDTQFLALKAESKLGSLNLFKKGYALAEPNSPICGQTIQQ